VRGPRRDSRVACTARLRAAPQVCGDVAPPSGGRWGTMSDPNVHWDGQRWLRWDGQEWVPDPTPAPQPQPQSHASIILGVVAAVVVFARLLGGGGFWLIKSRGGTTPAGDTTTSITTVPINATQDSFTDPVGTDQQITP